MSTDRVDPEQLAALLDGTLAGAEREAVLATLARSEQSFLDLVESAALLRELESTPRAAAARPALAPMTPMTPKAPARWRSIRAVSGVAGLAAAVVVAVVLLRRSRDPRPGELVAVVAAMAPRTPSGSAVSSYGVTWNQPDWSNARGSAEATRANGKVLFRAGVRFAELEAATAVRDTLAAHMAARALMASIAGVDGGGLVTPLIEQTATSAADRPSLAARVRDLADVPQWFDLGVWSEAARLAVLSGRMEFFVPDGFPINKLKTILSATDRLDSREQDIRRVAAPLRSIAFPPRDSRRDPSAVRPLIDSALAVGIR